MKQIILLSDTHHTLDERFFPHFERADEIWHAGDIGDLSVTDKLKDFAPIRGVWGNIDNKTIRTEFKRNLYFKCEEINFTNEELEFSDIICHIPLKTKIFKFTYRNLYGKTFKGGKFKTKKKRKRKRKKN